MVRDRVAIVPDRSSIPRIVSGLGLAFLAAFGLEIVFFSGLDPSVFASARMIASTIFITPFVGSLVYGGVWLGRSGVSTSRYPRVLGWCLASSVGFLGLNAFLLAFFPPDSLWLTVGWLRGTATIGATGGMVVGIVEARAIDAEVETLRTTYLETQREGLDYLNGLLRHEVLNTAQVINGYSSVILEEADLSEKHRENLAAIHRQSRDMADVVDDIHLMAEAMREEVPLRPVALTPVLRGELQDLRDTTDGVDVRADLPEDVYVRADDFLPRLFGILFSNAVEHHDGDEPRVEVGVEEHAESVRVRVSDDGPGVPPERRETLFERDDVAKANQELGLYLASRLVARYDGDVELTETGPEGSTFTVQLHPAEEPEPEEAAGSGSGDASELPTSSAGVGETAGGDAREVADARPDSDDD